MLVAFLVLLLIGACAFAVIREEELRSIYELAKEISDSFFDDEEEGS